MTESNHSSDPQRDPVTDDLPETASEQELDDLLAQASELAGDLSESVGKPDRTPTPAEPNTPSDADEDPVSASDLDEELARLEAQACNVSNEIGNVESDEPANTPQPSNHPSDESSTTTRASDRSDKSNADTVPSSTATKREDVPDFMRDMLADENDRAETKHKPGTPSAPAGTPGQAATADASPQRTTASATTSKLHMKPKPGVVGTGMLGVIGSPPGERDQTDNQAGDETEGRPSTSANEKGKESPAARIARLAEPTALNACQSVVQLLERVDRRLGLVGPRMRIFLGWVALATLATAIIVYLVALF